MQVRMMQEPLIPGVKYGEKAEPGAQMARIGGDGKQRFGDGAEQDAVNDPPVLQSQVR
jgi:hypothetical protein